MSFFWEGMETKLFLFVYLRKREPKKVVTTIESSMLPFELTNLWLFLVLLAGKIYDLFSEFLGNNKI